MVRSELIERMMQDYPQLSAEKAEQLVETFFNQLGAQLADGGRVELRGFGVFTVREYGGYKGRNPRNGVPVEVPPKRMPRFKAGKDLRERINRGR